MPLSTKEPLVTAASTPISTPNRTQRITAASAIENVTGNAAETIELTVLTL